MKIALCYPTVSFEYNKIRDSGMAPHLSLLCIASHLKSVYDDISFMILDGHHLSIEEIKDKLSKEMPDIVGYSVDFTNYANAVELSTFVKTIKPDVWNIVGSNHATNLYDIILKNQKCIDYVSLGDGEPSWEDLVAVRLGKMNSEDARNIAFRKGDQIHKTAMTLMNLDEMVDVEYDMIDMQPYFEQQKEVFGDSFRMMQFTSQRGCANKPLCVFCGRYTDGIRFRDPKKFAKEIAYWTDRYELTEVWDRSDSFIQNTVWLREFAEELEKHTDRFLNKQTTFKTYARADQILKPGIIDILKRLNFRMVFIGYEAGDDRILKNIGKHSNVDIYKRATDNVLTSGLDIDASFIVGLPGENKESLEHHKQFVEYLVGLGLDKIRVNQLLVLPGTPLYAAVMEKYPELKDKDIISQDELQKLLFTTDLYDLSEFDFDVEKYQQELRSTAKAMTDCIISVGGGAEGYGYGKDNNILDGKQLQRK